MAAAARVGLLKRAWHEIPDVVASTGMAVIGLGMAGIGLYIYYANDGGNKRYKDTYTVYRPDDPRVKLIKE